MKKICYHKIILKLILSFFCLYPLFYGKPILAKEGEDKELFAYVGGVNELVKIDLKNYEITKNLRFPGGGHIVFGLSISPDGKTIYAAGDMFSSPMIFVDSKMLKISKVLSKEGFEDVRFHDDYMSSGLRLSPDGRRLVIDCRLGSMPFAVIDMLTLKVLKRYKEISSKPTYQVLFSDNSKLIYVLTELPYKNKITILDANSGKILKQVSFPELEKGKCETDLSDYIGEKLDIYISCHRSFNDFGEKGLLKGDAIYPFTATRDSNKIKLIEVKTGKTLNEIPMPDGQGSLNQIAITPDGKRLLIGRGGYRDPGELTIVDVKSKKVVARIMLEGGATSNVVFGYE